jgi:hypothetical protein
MRVGIDLDNTIVSYDELFADLAVEQGLLPTRAAGGKRAVRDALRARPGGEAAWQRLQAAAYGRQMARAAMFEGVAGFLGRCRRSGIEVHIISHKTRRAAADPEGADLHRAALAWLRARGFFDDDGFGLAPSAVHFEATRDAKLRRIAATGCSHFIDDLAEVLADPAFPQDVARYLFAPDGAAQGPYVTCRNWRELGDELLAAA